MKASTRVVARCHDKISDICELAATRTTLICILAAIPVAVGSYAMLDRFASMPEVFRIVAAVLIVLLGLSIGTLAAGSYLRQKPQDYDETRSRLIPYFARKDAVVGDAWKTVLSNPGNCPRAFAGVRGGKFVNSIASAIRASSRKSGRVRGRFFSH